MLFSPSAFSIAVAATLIAPFTAHSGLVDNLKGYWSFEADYSDQSGNGRTGTPGGAGASTILSASVFGKVGDSAQFNGSNQYVFLPITYGVLPNSPTTPTMLGQNFTISSWYYLTGTTAGTTRYFLYENDQPGTAADVNRYTLSYEIRSDIGLGDFAGSVTAGVNPTAGTINLSRFEGAAPGTATANSQPTWVNLLHTYTANTDGTTTVTTYFNGLALNSPGAPFATNHPQTQQTSIVFEGSGINLGTYRDANGRWWKGYIDEVAVWDRVLTEGEIGNVYNLGLNGQSIPEPSAGLLLAAGVVALGAFRRRREAHREQVASATM